MLGTIDAHRRDDDTCVITKADPMVAVSLVLFSEWLTAGSGLPVQLVDGLMCMSGVDAAGDPVAYRYRVVGFQAASEPLLLAQGMPEGEIVARLGPEEYAALKANEGGYLLIMRVD